MHVSLSDYFVYLMKTESELLILVRYFFDLVAKMSFKVHFQNNHFKDKKLPARFSFIQDLAFGNLCSSFSLIIVTGKRRTRSAFR